MCLIALALGLSEQWPLVLASNRDEYFHRPALPLARWTTTAGQVVISGRDLEAGGTWLGLTPSGKVAALTNVREPGQTPGHRSRGELPLAWLESHEDASTFLLRLKPEAYSGFNLIIGDMARHEWHWVSNRQMLGAAVVPGWQHLPMEPGLYGLSNAFLDTPWPKTLRLKAALQAAMQGTDDPQESLWRALADSAPAPEHALPCTGVSPNLERQLSSAFVRLAEGHYGTRASTLLTARNEGGNLNLSMSEKTWLASGAGGMRQEQFTWRASGLVIG